MTVYLYTDLTNHVLGWFPLDEQIYLRNLFATDRRLNRCFATSASRLTSKDLKKLYLHRRVNPQKILGVDSINDTVLQHLKKMLTDPEFMKKMTDAVSWGHQYMLLLDTPEANYYTSRCNTIQLNHKYGPDLTLLERYVPKGTKLCYSNRNVLCYSSFNTINDTYFGVYLVLFDAEDHPVYKHHCKKLDSDSQKDSNTYHILPGAQDRPSSNMFIVLSWENLYVKYQNQHEYPNGTSRPYIGGGHTVYYSKSGFEFTNAVTVRRNPTYHTEHLRLC